MSDGPPRDVVADLRAAGLRERPLVLLLDYDGTLTPIAPHPRLAVLAQDTRQRLAQLSDCPRVHVGVVSGRKLDELQALVGVPGLCFAGACGMELDLHGNHVVHPLAQEAAERVANLVVQLENAVANAPGAWVENKQLAATVHYRDAAAERIDPLRRQVIAMVGSCPQRWRIVEGPMALELTPDLGWNKGTAVQKILEHLGDPQALVVYAGDGENDGDAFEMVAALGGVTLGIGPDAPPTARHRLPDPAALAALLSRLAVELGLRLTRRFTDPLVSRTGPRNQ